MSDMDTLPTRVVAPEDRGKARRRLTASRVVPALMAVSLVVLIGWDIATECEMIARGPGQFLHDNTGMPWRASSPVAVMDVQFAPASAPRAEVPANDTNFHGAIEHEDDANITFPGVEEMTDGMDVQETAEHMEGASASIPLVEMKTDGTDAQVTTEHEEGATTSVPTVEALADGTEREEGANINVPPAEMKTDDTGVQETSEHEEGATTSVLPVEMKTDGTDVQDTTGHEQGADISLPSVEMKTEGTDVQETTEPDEGCVAKMVNPHNVSYPSDHRFYSMLRDITPMAPPVFRGDHAVLCDATDRDKRRYQYCLPITGRKDEPYCSAPDRLDLLARQSRDSRCYGSVLHMLMADVYNEFKKGGAQPLVVFGSLLGAIRDTSVISFTEDADISYMKLNKKAIKKLRRRLWKKGYHMFLQDIWRVCVAPTHPLAANLYDPEASLVKSYQVPYVDLYEMERESPTDWRLEAAKNGRLLPDTSVRPFVPVRINGLEFDTVRDPIGFLTEEYGEDFMTPKPRH